MVSIRLKIRLAAEAIQRGWGLSRKCDRRTRRRGKPGDGRGLV